MKIQCLSYPVMRVMEESCILKIARCVPFVFGSIVLFLVPACQSAIPNKSEFVRTVNFSKLQSFRYKHTLATGMEWRDAQRILLEELTCKVINEEFESRGFERGESDADIVAVVKWRKAASDLADSDGLY